MRALQASMSRRSWMDYRSTRSGVPSRWGGVAGFVEHKRGPRNAHPNRVPSDIEKRNLDYSLQYPTHRPQRVANQLRLENVNVSAGGVRRIWLWHDLETRYKRLLWLE